jgi:hypothetical protein
VRYRHVGRETIAMLWAICRQPFSRCRSAFPLPTLEALGLDARTILSKSVLDTKDHGAPFRKNLSSPWYKYGSYQGMPSGMPKMLHFASAFRR